MLRPRTVVRVTLVVLLGAVLSAYVRRSLPPRGALARTLAFGGLERSYLLYAGGAAKKAGLVLVLHGLDGSGVSIAWRTRRAFDALADREGIVVVYPDAVGGAWNVGSGGSDSSSRVDDVGFLVGLIDSLRREFDIDPRRVYAVGLSRGASMAYRLACEPQTHLAAIGAVAGWIAEPVAARCTDGPSVPIVVIHGTEDPVIPFDWAVTSSLAVWTKRNRCAAPPATAFLPDVDGTDGTRTRLEHYASCADGSEILLYAIEGGAHRWPDDDPWKPFWRVGRTSRDFDAVGVIWEVFRRHPLPARSTAR